MKTILVVGSINVDLVITTPRIPQIGETIKGCGFRTGAGGKGANQAAAIAKMGGNVKMIGCVGADTNRHISLDAMEKYGVDSCGVKVTGTTTGVAMITVCDGDNCIILDSGANDLVTKEIIDENEHLFEMADYVVFQLEIPLDTVIYAASVAKKHSAKVVLNPAPMCTLPEELINLTDIFAPNHSEAEIFLGHTFSGIDGAMAALEEIQSRGIENVIITLGSDGCVYSQDGKTYHRGIVAAPVVDTTAAGDTFIAGILTMLCEGKKMSEAVDFATYASSLCVQKSGAMDTIPSKEEVIAYMKK